MNPKSHAHTKLLMQDKKEAPSRCNPPRTHGNGRPTPGGEAPGWASSLSGRARLLLRARPLGFAAVVLCAGALLSRLGLTVNFTASLPRGVYQRVHPTLQRGSLVLVCLPESRAAFACERGYLGPGSCPGGTEPLGKRVAALEGDEVELTYLGLYVNGRLLPGTAPLSVDSRGRPMPCPEKTRLELAPREILVFTSHPKSFDSRYFGALSTSSSSWIR